ncbi:MAG: hypothetical protein KAS47_04260 [Candidatus Heimdallarchaeota archaeon]|nr:hypothetical protein [Candidatus Heimdallarchaeota archaeon]
MLEQLTFSSIYDTTKNITISDDILNALSEVSKNSNILSIYSTNARAIYFFPVSSDVYKLSIQIFPLTPEIVAKIMTKIAEFSTKVVYSTGLCLVENRCFWEGFLQEKDLTKPITDIEEILQSIAEIKETSIEKVHSST